MAQQSNPASSGNGSTALDREAVHVDKLMNGGKGGETSKETKEGENGLNNPTQVEQDQRIAEGIADAKAASGGPDQPENGLNQDG